MLRCRHSPCVSFSNVFGVIVLVNYWARICERVSNSRAHPRVICNVNDNGKIKNFDFEL